MKKNKKLYYIHIIISILIFCFLPVFVDMLIHKYPGIYPEDEGATSNLTLDIANKIAIYVWPILIGYIIMIYVLIKNKVDNRKIYYPLSFTTLVMMIFNLGVIYYTHMFLWYLVMFILPILIAIIILAIVGYKQDKNNLDIKKTMKILYIIFALFGILFGIWFWNIMVSDNNKEEINIHENYENIKKEFENKLTSEYIKIDILNLTENEETLLNLELLINIENLPNDKMEFSNEVVKTYENIKDLLIKYNYDDDIVRFNFNTYNPYNNNAEAYYDGGYIKENEDSYYVFLDGRAIIIEKDGN